MHRNPAGITSIMKPDTRLLPTVCVEAEQLAPELAGIVT